MSEARATTGTKGAPVTEGGTKSPRVGDWVMALVLLALFIAAYFLAFDWPFRAALFPQIVAAAGAVLSAIKVAGLTLAAWRSPRSRSGVAVLPSTRAADLPEQPQDSSPESESVRTAAMAAGTQSVHESEPASADFTIVDDEQEDDQSLEYVFASAGGRAWAAALGWIALFFVSFFVLGAYITVPLFALIYLRFSGRASWLGAAIYAAVTGVLIFVVFRDVVYIPLPQSVFPFLDF